MPTHNPGIGMDTERSIASVPYLFCIIMLLKYRIRGFILLTGIKYEFIIIHVIHFDSC